MRTQRYPNASTKPSGRADGVDAFGKSVIVLKRSMRPGFAGVDNDLYYNEKCMMLFSDAKDSLTKLITEMKSLL